MSRRQWMPWLAGVLPVLLALCGAGEARAERGVSVATTVVPADSPSAADAVVAGHVLRLGFERNPRFAVVDESAVLDPTFAAPAGRRLRDAQTQLETGRAAFDAVDYDTATAALADAVVAYDQSAPVLKDARQLVDALALLGASHAMLGQSTVSERAFARLLALDPDYNLPLSRFDTDVQAVFDRARATAELSDPGSLSIYSTPRAAEVWVDGRFQGAAPLALDGLKPGRHLVQVRRAGYRPFGQMITVETGREQTVQAALRPTGELATYESLQRRLAGGDTKAAVDLARLLKVDQVVWARVQSSGRDVTVSGQLISGVTGVVEKSAQQTFVSTAVSFRPDLERFFAQFRRAPQSQVGTANGGGQTGTAQDNTQYLPPEKPEETISATVWTGWGLTVGAVVPLAVGITFGYLSGVARNDFRALPDQTSQDVNTVRNAWFQRALVADLSYAVAAGMLTGGVVALVMGYNEKEQIEDVLAQGHVPDAHAPGLSGGDAASMRTALMGAHNAP